MTSRSLLAKIASLASGGALAMLVNALAYPVLAHFYDPTEYGSYGIFLFFAGIFSAVSSFKFDLIIPLQRQDGDIYKVICASAYNILIVSTAALIASTVYYEGSTSYIILTFMSVVFYGIFQIAGAILIAYRANVAAGALLFIQAVVAVAVQIGLSAGSMGWYGLVFGYISSLAASCVVGWVLILRYRAFTPFAIIGVPEYLAILREQKARWQANMLQGFVNAISLNFLAYGCLQTGGKEAVGLFSFCQRIMTIPVRVVGNSVRQVLLREYSSSSIDSSALRAMVRLVYLLLGVSSVVFLVLSLILPYLIEWFLPRTWGDLGRFVYPIAIWLVFTIAYVPAISMLNAVGTSWLHAVYEVANLFQRGAILLLAVLVGSGPVLYLYITSGISAVLIIAFIFLTYFYSSRSIIFPENRNA